MPACVGFVNNSTVVSDADIQAAIPDFQSQVTEDFFPFWLVNAQLAFGPGEWVVSIEDDATIQGAFGFHEELNGVPTAHVFARTSEQSGVNWTAVASHELLEMLADPRTNMIVSVDNDPNGVTATEYAAEACDAVEQSSYTKGNTVVSDFVTPAWFDPNSTSGPYDFLNLVSAPLQLEPGGSYIGTRTITASTGWQSQTADKA